MFILYKKRIVNKNTKNNFVTKPYGCALFNPVLKKKKNIVTCQDMIGQNKGETSKRVVAGMKIIFLSMLMVYRLYTFMILNKITSTM